MRLINTTTYEIDEFFGDIPKYAILSHTWEGKELTFQQVCGKPIEELLENPRFLKIRYCCEQARRDGLDWTWIDTCCIDKTSSAELSEAINSMFEWYEKARFCYAYLADVEFNEREVTNDPTPRFVKARWFTRGWTLQELLAPSYIRFYDRSWNFIGSRDDFFMQTSITKATGIERLDAWEGTSVACKFSWAARRQTTRPEDQAYSLMGLFGVNMPLLYGEGSRAFRRLQLEILRQSHDESIFA